MTIEQKIEVPVSHWLFLEVPPEVPAGEAKLTYTSDSVNKDTGFAGSDELKAMLKNLHGSLDKNAFGGLDGVAYQRKVRNEWDS